MKNFKFKIENRFYEVDIVSVDEKTATVDVNGVLYEVEVDQKFKTARSVLPRKDFVPSSDASLIATKTDKNESGHALMRSPLPGKVIAVMVKIGDNVSVGQTVVCIDAMKMENNIRSDKEGVVKAVYVEADKAVMNGDILLEIEPAV